MSETIENIELLRFYHSLIQDVKAIQISDEEGGIQEQIFTQAAVDLLADAGETENVRVAHDEKALGTRNQHKINAYSISDNYETIDLFITVFNGWEEPNRIAKDEIETSAKRISNFFKKGMEKEYVNQIDESSQIFDFAHTLYQSKELKDTLVRINAFILTDGFYLGDHPENVVISGYPVYYRVIDINYLYNVSEKSHIPIEIDFRVEGFEIPCIPSPSENSQYESYLAIIPGKALASIYERFGSRLLEQNVRSFLQFTGKINQKIRTTIITEPEMFLAFNNGISATAESLTLEKAESGKGFLIKKVMDFQIVNGGQTTASIFHTSKKDKANISEIFVQLKVSVVKDRTNFSQIVTRISEYANTQNKVSFSDLSANNPFYIELEKLSRVIFTPPVPSNSGQTKWFFERARGQYKNERTREGRTPAKLRAFDAQNPRKQLFTKEDLAKFTNSYSEVAKSNKIIAGPHVVARGNQKNHKVFIDSNLPSLVDDIYFEDTVAKAIIFKAAERIYGIKPNAIGDMRFITVPYTISYLNYSLRFPIDLHKIWKAQGISDGLENILKPLMVRIEEFIKSNAPGSLYSEWAKKEECWSALKASKICFDLAHIENDLIDPQNPVVRKKKSKEFLDSMVDQFQSEKINGIGLHIWKRVKDWGQQTEILSLAQLDRIHNFLQKASNNGTVSNDDRLNLIEILEITSKRAPEILSEEDNNSDSLTEEEILVAEAGKMIEWIKKEKHSMTSEHFTFLKNIKKGIIKYSIESKTTLIALEKYLRQYGY